ncbi:flagellar motor protein MotA [Phreatobacter cathodiphilus]|uniref:Flagellar motor protein MotA n=1 Tax=Phreatobacter cathodiphilus TaxID=1868589 RepID=A0A2S0N6A7_9HYPH|nr:flagellar motor protein MotA [Phreatobacter cathodiphilus]AVO43670.1 flagellar motor protein MotA [Phreatobacter cathodiphilus]
MARELDPFKVSSPRIFLFRMLVFLALVGLVVFVLQREVQVAFMANPGLNGVIVAVGLIGVILSFRQVIRLFREARWVNTFRLADPGIAVEKPPVLLAPMATMLGARSGQMAISTVTMRSLLDSLATRLDEGRELARYLTGLLVFLGLLGTFWGLIETVTSVGRVINSLSNQGELGTIFEDMKRGLAEPLGGMGIAFSSSLFGLAGSLVLGFLDLQASQAQNRFYTEVEDWLSSTVQDMAVISPTQEGGAPQVSVADLQRAFDRLREALGEGSSNQRASAAMANLAEGIQGLVTHMRSEQQVVRDWMQAQSADQKELRRLLEQMLRERGPV